MKALSSSQICAYIYQSTRRRISEDFDLCQYSC